MLNAFIAILVEKEVLELEEGKALVEKLKFSTLPGDFHSSQVLIKKLFMQIEKEK